MTFSEQVQQSFDAFSSSERHIAEFMLRRLEEVPFLSATEIAGSLGLSTSGVTRFAQRLGYEGYPHLQKQVSQELHRLHALTTAREGDGLLPEYWRGEARNFEELLRLPDEQIERAAEGLANARQVWVLGARATLPAAHFAAHFLGLLHPRVQLLTPAHLAAPEVMLNAGPQDAALAFTVRRYAQATARLGEWLAGRGVALTVVTDDGPAPLAKHAPLVLRVPTRSVLPFGSFMALTSLTQAIVVAVAQRLGKERLVAVERLLEDLETFEY